jgi:hypothetical protein
MAEVVMAEVVMAEVVMAEVVMGEAVMAEVSEVFTVGNRLAPQYRFAYLVVDIVCGQAG